MKQAHIYISGMVQGVGFRAFVKNKARKLRLTGWVKNLSDGRVEAIFQGEKDKIEQIISLSNRGPFLAEVNQVVVEWEEAGELFTEFSQR